MAIVYMDEITIADYKLGQTDNIGYEYDTGDVASAGNGDSIIIPDNVQSISLVLEVTAGSGSVEWTLNTVANVLAETAVWHSWDAQTVVTTLSDVFYPCTAIRMVNASGTTRLKVRAQ